MKNFIKFLFLVMAVSCFGAEYRSGIFGPGGGGGGGSGTVTSVGWTGGIVSVATPTTTPAFTIAGTSGGIPYFSSTSTWASSALLAANALVIGGGAGVAPATTTTGSGVLIALGINVGSAGAFVTFNGNAGTPSALVGTNISGTAAGLTAGNVTTNANLTGAVTSVGNATSLGSFTFTALNTALTGDDAAGLTTAQTLTSKRITLRVATLTDGATVTPDSDSFDGGILTTLSQNTTLANPTGTPTQFQRYMLRIKSTTARTLTYGSQYRGSADLALPAATSGSSLTDYFVFTWNVQDSKWDFTGRVFGF